MQIFVYDLSSDPLALLNSQFVAGYNEAVWIERYRVPGEFKVSGLLQSGLLELMPLGALVGQMDSMELMYVESQRVIENKNEEAKVEISGRTIDAWLENRIVGMNQNWSNPPLQMTDFTMPAASTWIQVVNFINAQITTAGGALPEEVIPGLQALWNITGGLVSKSSVARQVKRGPLDKIAREVLGIDDLGIMIYRKNPFGLGNATTFTNLIIHNGYDRSSTVTFSAKNGNVENSEYLRTNLASKNAALVNATYVETRSFSSQVPETGVFRREVLVEADDIDKDIGAPPAIGSPARQTILDYLVARGHEALYSSNQFLLARCDIAKNAPFKYRRDYNIGDLVSVSTAFGGLSRMRIVEHTEIEDQNGHTGHPTLEALL